MATYDASVAAANLSAAMTDPEVYLPVQKAIVEGSHAMRLARRLPNMARGTMRMSIMNLFPVAYWQATGTSLKQTTYAQWRNKTITAEEIAVLVPISINVLRDTEGAGYNIWDEIRPLIGQAFGALIDVAIFSGTSLPATWLTNTSGVSKSLITMATDASAVIERDSVGVDLYDDILGENGLVSLLEMQGFDVTGYVAHLGLKGALRHVRDNRTGTGAGQPVLIPVGSGSYGLNGSPISFPKNASIDSTAVQMIAGDWSQLVYSIRTDMEVTPATEAVINDDDGAIVFNLFQQDMVALRFVMRLGFQVSNPVTLLSPTEGTRSPFGILTPAGT